METYFGTPEYLEIISVNIWTILASLANLGILYWGLKKFLYKPVKNVIAARQAELQAQYDAAAAAEQAANESRDAYAAKLDGAQAEADGIIHEATATANRRGEKIVAEAREKAASIVRQGEMEAEMEKKKAQESIRRDITDVSAALAEQLLGREMNADDHAAMIDSFLQGIGDAQ
ncbi:MAG: F0F1 ATP synthase subunit B [Clostridia bacterium]|nr:F0F1 ATP synthase subunit B [Clostridia bacterium]